MSFDLNNFWLLVFFWNIFCFSVCAHHLILIVNLAHFKLDICIMIFCLSLFNLGHEFALDQNYFEILVSNRGVNLGFGEGADHLILIVYLSHFKLYLCVMVGIRILEIRDEVGRVQLRNPERAGELDSFFEGVSLPLSDQILDVEEERNLVSTCQFVSKRSLLFTIFGFKEAILFYFGV